MPKGSLVRDGILLLAALAAGWWAHSPRPAVHAAESYETPYSQFSNAAGEGTLSV